MARAPGVTTSAGSRGRAAEVAVAARARSALGPAFRVYENVSWLGRTREHGANRDGEADLVIAHPERGILVVEVKAGEIRRERGGKWFGGGRVLDVSPQEQARNSKYALVAKLKELPSWPVDLDPIAGHAVAFPDVDVSTASGLLGPDLDAAIVLDAAALETDARARQAIDGTFDFWERESIHRRPPGRVGIELLDSILDTPITLTSRLQREIAEAEPLILQLTKGQYQVLRQHGRFRRLDIAGCAGSGKTMLAAEKARMLAREGFDTLVVCFNSPLARELSADLAEARQQTGRLEISTFHGLCERLANEAGVLPPKPSPVPSEWFADTLPNALVAAAEQLGARYHAIVVDEGQDFALEWLESLQFLMHDPRDDVFWVFHDEAQSLYREDRVASLGMARVDLDVNCRNPAPIHELASRFAEGQPESYALREKGRPPEIIEAERGRPTLEAVRKVLYRLRHDEGVAPWDIAVLTGRSMANSDVWHQRTFGNESLWNGHVDEAGNPLGIPVEQVPDVPSDAILMDSIRRFKGLERPVIVLVELDEQDEHARQLLYVGISRARQHVVVVATPELATTLRAA